MTVEISIEPVETKSQRKEFIDLSYRLNASDPHWVPPLKTDVKELLTPGKNPFFEHADVQLFLARRAGKTVGRISAHIDHLALKQPPEKGLGPGTGNWGLLEATDETVAQALIKRAENWLKDQGMTRVVAPISLSVWDEPGLLVKGHDTHPVIMMGHDDARHESWITGCGYQEVKRLISFRLPVADGFPDIVGRIVKSGERNSNIHIRQLDRKNFASEVRIILNLLNDAWATNWGFVPLTESEVAYVGKKLKPLGYSETNMIAEMDGKPVAFMLALPDLNEVIKPMKGSMLPFGWFKLLRWLRRPNSEFWRVPLMGVKKELQNSRLASQLAFMMIEYIRRGAVDIYGAKFAEIGWVLEDNQGMQAIAKALESKPSREYMLYEKALG